MRMTIVMALILVTSNVYAVAPQFWKVRNAEDFLAGEIEGFAISSRGELHPGPARSSSRILSEVSPNGGQ